MGVEKVDYKKFKGVFPALYACYDEEGRISKERTKALANHLYKKGVHGLYVGGSSGECIYQTVEERKKTLAYVSEQLKGKLTLIAHIGAPSTEQSIELAKYAEELEYDALSSIPPIYFQLPEHAIYDYWMAMIEATSLPFFIYNIPQTTGYALSIDLLKRLSAHQLVIGVKNSSMPVLDIERFKAAGGENFIIFNGPDEQYVAGRLIGADGGIGGTYGAMPELYLKAEQYIHLANFEKAREIQKDINDIIVAMTSMKSSMYAVIKEILKLQGVEIGSVRAPLAPVYEEELREIKIVKERIDQTVKKHS